MNREEDEQNLVMTSVQNELARRFNFERVKPSIMKFVLKTEQHMTELQKVMKTTADVYINASNMSNITIEVTPNHVTSCWNHSEFEKECRSILQQFFAKFDVWKGQYDPEELKTKSQIKPHLFKTHSHGDLYVKWHNSGAVIVVGIQNEVNNCKQEIEDILGASSGLAQPPLPLGIETAQHVHKIRPIRGRLNGNDRVNRNGVRPSAPWHFPTPQSAATSRHPKSARHPNQRNNRPVTTSCAPTSLHGFRSKGPRRYPTPNFSSTPLDHLRRTSPTSLPRDRPNYPRRYSSQMFASIPRGPAQGYAQHQNSISLDQNDPEKTLTSSHKAWRSEDYNTDYIPGAVLRFVLKELRIKAELEKCCQHDVNASIQSKKVNGKEHISVTVSGHYSDSEKEEAFQRIREFFSKYETKQVKCDNLEKIKKECEEMFSDEAGKLYIRTFEDTAIVKITGLKEKVLERYEEIINVQKSTVEEDNLPVDKYIAQRECQVWEKVEKMCEENGLQVSLNPNPNGKIVYKGNRDAIKSAKELVEKIWEQLYERPIHGFTKNHVEFLRKCENSQKNFFETNENVLDYVYQKFRDKSTCGSILFNDSSISLISTEEDLWVEANKILLNFIKVDRIDGINQIPVKKLYLKIKLYFENKPVLVKEEENKAVLVYCLKTQRGETRRTIDKIKEDTIQACDEIKKFHPMSKEKAQHICKQHSISNAKKTEVKQENGQIGLFVTCRNEDTDAVAMRLEELDKQITDISGSISGYFLYETLKGSGKCLEIEHDTGCSIFLQPLHTDHSISCGVFVKVGDILNEDCDAIVNSTGDGLNFESSNQLSKALITKYGSSTVQSISGKQTSVLIPNQACSFFTKDLMPWNYIINVAIPSDGNKLKQFISDLLQSVDNAGIKSLALPAIGTGNMGLDPHTVAKCMGEAFHTFFRDSNVKNLKDIRVVVYKSELLPIFQQGVPSQNSAFGIAVNSANSAGIDVKIYGNSADKVNQAHKKLMDLCSATITKEVIQKHRLSHYIKAKINELCGRFSIHLEWHGNSVTTKDECHLEGPKDHVEKAKEGIESLLDSDIPYYWEPMSNEKFELKEVRDPVEYTDVAIKFKKSSPTYSWITKIERIQNPFLYKQFKTRKDIVKSDITSQCVTRELFHGTLPDKAEKIYSAGFDRNYAGANGTAYGRGVYFHINSNYSVRYCGHTSQEKSIFLAEVITGDYVQGKSEYKSPPENPTKKRLYDSVVDNVHNPNIFVVFRDSSVYPMYLIHFI